MLSSTDSSTAYETQCLMEGIRSQMRFVRGDIDGEQLKGLLEALLQRLKYVVDWRLTLRWALEVDGVAMHFPTRIGQDGMLTWGTPQVLADEAENWSRNVDIPQCYTHLVGYVERSLEPEERAAVHAELAAALAMGDIGLTGILSGLYVPLWFTEPELRGMLMRLMRSLGA